MNWKKWKIGFAVSIAFGLLTAGAGLAAGMSWQAFIAVLSTSLVTQLGAYLMKHPIEDICDDAEPPKGGTPNLPVWFIGGFLVASLGLCACVPRGQIKPGADPLVVQAEALAENAGESMNAFVQWEFRNRDGVGSDVTASADLVREFGPTYIRQLKQATRTYKSTRKSEAKSDLQAAVNTLQSLLDQAREYYQPNPTP